MRLFSDSSEHLQYVLDEKLSDHKPLIAEGFLVWNMLCLGKVINNGFRMDETVSDAAPYKARLKKAASSINRWIEAAALSGRPIDVLCLQEAPYLPEYLSLFLEALDMRTFDRDAMVSTKTAFHKFQNLTLYSKHYVGKNITHQLSVPEDCQNHRYHILELTHQKTGNVLRVANVHFSWFPSKKMGLRLATRKTIKTLICQHHCNVMGDFNQSLSWLLEDDQIRNLMKVFYYPKRNNISFSKDPMREMQYGQIDALILV